MPNLFGKILVVYADVFQPEWDEVAFLMDAREMRLSRMMDTNDYYGDPMLETFDVADLPTKDTMGKELSFTSKIDTRVIEKDEVSGGIFYYFIPTSIIPSFSSNNMGVIFSNSFSTFVRLVQFVVIV